MLIKRFLNGISTPRHYDGRCDSQCFHRVTLKCSLEASYRVKPSQQRRENVNLTEQTKI